MEGVGGCYRRSVEGKVFLPRDSGQRKMVEGYRWAYQVAGHVPSGLHKHLWRVSGALLEQVTMRAHLLQKACEMICDVETLIVQRHIAPRKAMVRGTAGCCQLRTVELLSGGE